VSAATAEPTRGSTPARRLSTGAKRGIWIGAAVLVLLMIVLGTKVVPADDPRAQGTVEFDPATFGAENFPAVQQAVAEKAVDAATLSEAIAADPEAAAAEYAQSSSGGPVFSVTFSGVVGEIQSGIATVDVEGLSDDLLIRVQTGPAINGTELRDATDRFPFGDFTNQIDYQNAAAALNNEMKEQVLSGIDAADLSGQTISVTGAFTLLNPEAWLVTPTEMSVG